MKSCWYKEKSFGPLVILIKVRVDISEELRTDTKWGRSEQKYLL